MATTKSLADVARYLNLKISEWRWFTALKVSEIAVLVFDPRFEYSVTTGAKTPPTPHRHAYRQSIEQLYRSHDWLGILDLRAIGEAFPDGADYAFRNGSNRSVCGNRVPLSESTSFFLEFIR
jgi:hypothetical protein